MDIISRLTNIVTGSDGTRYYLMEEIQTVAGRHKNVSEYFLSSQYMSELSKVRYTDFDSYLSLLSPVIYIAYQPHLREELVDSFVEWLHE